MKKRKFSLFFLAAILLTLSFLCGCSNQSAEAEFNTFQAQEEILTTEQAKKEVKKDTTDVDQVKKEDVTVSGEKKDSNKQLPDEKLTEQEKNAPEDATQKAEAEARAKAEAEAKKKAEEEKKAQEPTAPASSGKSCTISIQCNTILNNMDKCDPAISGIVPSSGTILSTTTVEFTEGETVYDVLQRVCQSKGIQLEASRSPNYNSAYIEGIANIYEFDVGSGSGWMYKVNGWFPNYGCSSYLLEGGENICWIYTCSLGSDIGGGNWT